MHMKLFLLVYFSPTFFTLRMQDNFKRWGIHGTMRSLKTPSGVTEYLVYVKRMPKIVANKFDVAPGIIQDLVKTHLTLLEETRGTASTCPSGILKILNGKACRGFTFFFKAFWKLYFHSIAGSFLSYLGAIKFGDPLSLEKCQEVIKELSECDFPFQCAHGRPSMIPIVQLDVLPHLWK